MSKEAKRAKYDGNRVIIEPTRTTLQYRSGAHVKGEKSWGFLLVVYFATFPCECRLLLALTNDFRVLLLLRNHFFLLTSIAKSRSWLLPNIYLTDLLRYAIINTFGVWCSTHNFEKCTYWIFLTCHVYMKLWLLSFMGVTLSNKDPLSRWSILYSHGLWPGILAISFPILNKTFSCFPRPDLLPEGGR